MNNHLKPIINARREEQEKIGTGYEKQIGFFTPLNPNHHRSIFDECYQLDFLSWPVDEAEGERQTIENLTRRVFALNLAAIRPSSVSSIS